MKQFATGFSLVAALLLGLTSITAQTAVWSEDFDGGIPAGWGNDDAAPSNVLWTYCPDAALGNSNAGCAPIFTGQVPFASETETNGFVVVDSDQAGQLNANHVCRLTTTAINLSALTDVFVTFQTHIGVYTVSAETGAILRVSTDNVNWTDYTLFPGITTNVEWSANPAQPIVDISAVAAGQSTVYLQWQWTGNYEYMWELDDVKIYAENPAPANDLVLGDYWYPVSSYRTPESQIATDTFIFFAEVSNNGTDAQTNVTLKAVVREDGGPILYADSIVVPSLAPGVLDSSLTIASLFAPELGQGQYSIEYTLYADAADERPSDNAASDLFQVTEFSFAKEQAVEFTTRPASGSEYSMGNLYTMSSQSLEEYQATSITFAFSVDETQLPVADISAAVNLFRVNDDIAADWSNFEDTEFFSPSLTNVGFATYEAGDTTTEFSLQTVDLYGISTGELGVELDPGARYIATVSWEAGNEIVSHAFNDDVTVYFVNTLVYSSQWYLAGFGGDLSAVLRMGISLVTSTDEKPLADNTMSIFPNPVVNGNVNLDLNFDQPTDATITIADMTGRVISVRDRMGVTQEQVNFNLPQLVTGTYIARIATKEGTLTKKFIVQQ